MLWRGANKTWRLDSYHAQAGKDESPLGRFERRVELIDLCMTDPLLPYLGRAPNMFGGPLFDPGRDMQLLPAGFYAEAYKRMVGLAGGPRSLTSFVDFHIGLIPLGYRRPSGIRKP